MPAGSKLDLPFEGHSKESLLTFTGLGLTHFLLLTVAVIGINELFFGVDLLHPKLRMDASWYWNISQNGYNYTSGQQSSVAFYPLFSWIWKWTGFGYLGIVIVNSSLLLFSLYLIAVEYQIKGFLLLILLAVPSLMFCIVPYSESTFFIGATLLLLGFKNENLLLVVTGTIISCLTRSASAVLIICFILTYLICEDRPFKKEILLKYGLAIFCSIITSIMVRSYQVYEVGVDFSLFEVQAQWNRHLSLPSLPLTTSSQTSLVWNDFLALFTAMICGSLAIRMFLRRLEKPTNIMKPEVMLACLYIAGIASVTLLFSGTLGERGTSIHSLNRFVFSTPFFTVFLIYLLNEVVIKKRDLYCLGSLFFLLYLSFIIGSTGRYETLSFQIQVLGYFGIMTAIPILYIITSFYKKVSLTSISLYTICIALQAFLYCAHLSGLRVG